MAESAKIVRRKGLELDLIITGGSLDCDRLLFFSVESVRALRGASGEAKNERRSGEKREAAGSLGVVCLCIACPSPKRRNEERRNEGEMKRRNEESAKSFVFNIFPFVMAKATYRCMCCGSILSSVSFLSSFVLYSLSYITINKNKAGKTGIEPQATQAHDLSKV